MRSSGWLLATAAWLLSGAALAVPRVEVVGNSSCPTPKELERQVAQFAITGGDSEPHFRMEVQSSKQGASIKLFDADNQPALERSIDSDDCQALAAAFAFIVRAHFLKLGLELAEPATPNEPTAQPSKGAETVVDAKPRSPSERLPASEPESSQADRARKATSEPTDPTNWWVGGSLALGARSDLPGVEFAPLGLAEVTLQNDFLALHLAASADTGATTSELHPVQRQASSLILGAGLRWGQTLWVEPQLGAGLVLARVRAEGAAGAKQATSVSPAVMGALRVGYGTSFLEPWLELGTLVLTKRDRYLLEPYGNVGLGPRWQVRGLAGLQLTF